MFPYSHPQVNMCAIAILLSQSIIRTVYEVHNVSNDSNMEKGLFQIIVYRSELVWSVELY
jgi:hypothetical protein